LSFPAPAFPGPARFGLRFVGEIRS